MGHTSTGKPRRAAVLNEPKMVRCADCIYRERDTEGISRRMDTGEYFMGRCRKGHGAPYKIFMDKERICKDHKSSK